MARTVVVTGGGTGIGRATALRFAMAGDDVYVTGRRAEPLGETAALASKADAPGAVHALVCDSAAPDQLRALFAQLPERVDVLVNNAGGNTDFAAAGSDESLESLSDAWRANFEANVLTAVLTTEALAPRLADSGSVISIGSIGAEKGAGSYGAAKAALASWNVYVAGVLGVRGITANVVSPGYTVETEFFRDTLTAQRRESLITATKNGRAGTPDDVAETIYFLASPGARHLTAQVLNVNGGAWSTR
jgi:3-oxoacyl-[acyl-carrier protein] reductase